MNYWFFLFVVVVLGITFFLQKPREALTCSRPIYGPNGLRPGLYGPGDGPYNPRKGAPPAHPGCRVRNTQMIDDDGKFSSDTATRNPAYAAAHSIDPNTGLPLYTYEPNLDDAFPTDGEPTPFLTDFGKIGR